MGRIDRSQVQRWQSLDPYLDEEYDAEKFGRYMISTHGFIYSYWSGRTMRRYFECRWKTSLKDLTISIPHAMLIVFVRPQGHGEIAQFRDGNPRNCRLDNLYWGRMSDITVNAKQRDSKLSIDDIRDIREARYNGALCKELAKQYRVSPSQISRITTGECWKNVDSIY